MLTRRSALLFLGAATLAACAAPSGSVLRVGSQRGGTKAMMEASGVLHGLGFGLEWSEFPAAQHLLEALGAGAVDVGAVGDAPFLFAYQGGSPIRSVQATRYEPRNAATAIIVPATSPLRDAGGLRGKKVATGRGSVGHFLLLRAMEKAGLRQSDLTTVFLPPGDAKGAFDSGAVDAWATWNPYVGSAVLHDRARVIADARQLSTNFGVMAANEAAIADKRDLLSAFLARHDRAERWASDNTDAYAAVLARETGLPIEIARYFGNRGLKVVPTDAALLTQMAGVLETFRRAGIVDPKRPIAAAFDASFDLTPARNERRG
jgi:sulfonate transport system substrate-binding protein